MNKSIKNMNTVAKIEVVAEKQPFMRTLQEDDLISIIKNLDKKMISKEHIDALMSRGEYVCLGCGCSDNCACVGGCSWIDIDIQSGFGICSECEELMKIYTI